MNRDHKKSYLILLLFSILIFIGGLFGKNPEKKIEPYQAKFKLNRKNRRRIEKATNSRSRTPSPAKTKVFDSEDDNKDNIIPKKEPEGSTTNTLSDSAQDVNRDYIGGSESTTNEITEDQLESSSSSISTEDAKELSNDEQRKQVPNLIETNEIENPLKLFDESLFPVKNIEEEIKKTSGRGLTFGKMCESSVIKNGMTQKLADYPNVQLPYKSIEMPYSDSFFSIAGKLIKIHGIIGTKKLTKIVWKMFSALGPLKANPNDYVIMKNKKLFCGFTSPIKLRSEKEKTSKMEWTQAPILDQQTASAIDFRPIGFKTETSMERTKQQTRKIFMKKKMLDIGLDAIKTELNWDKTGISNSSKHIKNPREVNLKHFDFENFFIDTKAIAFPLKFELGNLSKHMWNRSLFLMILQETIISLKQKYALLKEIRKMNKQNREIKFDADNNEFYVEIHRQVYDELGDKKKLSWKKERKVLLGLESGVMHSDKTDSALFFGKKDLGTKLEGIRRGLRKKVKESMSLEYTNYVEEDSRIREKYKFPPGTAFISMEFGNVQCVVMQAPHSDVYNYAFNILDSVKNATTVIKTLGSFLIKKDKLSELYQNSVLMFTYSLFVNEACAEFPAFLMYSLSPTPEYANELSCLWMVQNSTKNIYEKYKEIIIEKFSEPRNYVQMLKRVFSAFRIRSTSNDIYFSEIAFARPDLLGEKYFMEAIKKMRQSPGITTEIVMENYRRYKHYFDKVETVKPSESSIKEIDMKSSALDFTGPNSSAMTKYNEKLSNNVFVIVPSNYSSSGTMTALASGASTTTQNIPPGILESRRQAIEEYESKTGSTLLETSIYNLCVQSMHEPDETTVFVKSQTQGVRGITVTKPTTKFKTQFAESLVRPLCHEEKENLILDVDKRAERVIEMTKNVRKQVDEMSDSRVESFALDLKNFNTFICLDFMAEIVSNKMVKAGYSKSSIDAYKELILSYKQKKIQIRLSSIRKTYEAWRYKYLKTGHYYSKIEKIKKKIVLQPQMSVKEHCQKRIERIANKVNVLLENCDKDLFEHFETISKSRIKLRKGEDYAIVLDQEWGMFQGILGCSATLMMTEIYKTFLTNYVHIRGRNYDFICMSDDANIVVELGNECSSEKFLEDLNSFMNLFGPRLNMMKCGSSSTTDIWFNSNKWSPLSVGEKEFERYYKEVHNLRPDTKIDTVNSIFKTKPAVEVRHLSRYLKLFFKDDLSVNYMDELNTKTSNYTYLLPFFKIAVDVSCIQTMTSLSSYLIRSNPLFFDTMRKCDPEQNYFFPSPIQIGSKCYSSPIFSKLIRGEFTNMINDRRRGLRYVYPEYSSIRKSEKFSDTLKKVTADKSSLIDRVDMCDFISAIVKSGDSEDRSPDLLIKTLYQPFYYITQEEHRWRTRLMGRTKKIYPIKAMLIEDFDAEVCSMYYLFENLKKQDTLENLRYYNFGKKSNFEPPSFTDLEYMLKNTSLVIDFDRYVSEASLFESKKEIEIAFPSGGFTGFDPDVLMDGDRVGTILTLQNPPSTWSCPQESKGKTWIHEGLYIKEFYVSPTSKLRFVFSLLDNNIISQNCILIEDQGSGNQSLMTIVRDKKMEDLVDLWRRHNSILFNYEKLPYITQENMWMSQYYWYKDRFISSIENRSDRLLTTTANARRLFVLKHDDKSSSEYEKTIKYGKMDYWRDEIEETEN